MKIKNLNILYLILLKKRKMKPIIVLPPRDLGENSLNMINAESFLTKYEFKDAKQM